LARCYIRATVASTGLPAFGEHDEIALGVADAGHPLLVAGRPEQPAGVAVDQVRRLDNVVVTERGAGRAEVVDDEIDE
jgi:hypothetical protein